MNIIPEWVPAIVADRNDMNPRLIYADVLQDNGDDEQADFIRASIYAPYSLAKRCEMRLLWDSGIMRRYDEYLEPFRIKPVLNSANRMGTRCNIVNGFPFSSYYPGRQLDNYNLFIEACPTLQYIYTCYVGIHFHGFTFQHSEKRGGLHRWSRTNG